VGGTGGASFAGGTTVSEESGKDGVLAGVLGGGTGGSVCGGVSADTGSLIGTVGGAASTGGGTTTEVVPSAAGGGSDGADSSFTGDAGVVAGSELGGGCGASCPGTDAEIATTISGVSQTERMRRIGNLQPRRL
jgi:hypothetical protein